MSMYRVALHGHAATEVTVEASSVQEANRKAIEITPTTRQVKSWTPVSTAKIVAPDVPRETKDGST